MNFHRNYILEVDLFSCPKIPYIQKVVKTGIPHIGYEIDENIIDNNK